MKKKVSLIRKKVPQRSRAETDDIKRYLGALAEDFQGRVSLIAEQFSGIHEKLDNHTEQFVEINKTLAEHSQILAHHTQILGEHSAKLDSHSAKLDSHSAKLDSHSAKLDSHTEMIGQLLVDVQEIKIELKEKVGRTEFFHLENRVTVLEARPCAKA